MHGLPHYRNLDQSGEAHDAVRRMEARALEPASDQMFQQLVVLMANAPERISEIGCGTGALSRRLKRATPTSLVFGADKSAEMIGAAQRLLPPGDKAAIHFGQWDVSKDSLFPFDVKTFDFILSSVMVPYLSEYEINPLIRSLVARLAPEGVLAFVEQDLLSDLLNFPSLELFRKIFAKDQRKLKSWLALGLRPRLRAEGLTTLPRRSFRWTDDAYGTYCRDLLSQIASSECQAGLITLQEQKEWLDTLEAQAKSGDFYYGIVCH